MTQQPVQEGDVLANKYRVEKVLGVGGMGVVVAARHLQLDERVALKFLLPEVARSPDIVARFAREAQAAVKIKSEHVARVSDVGTLEDGAPYMVMEYLDGGDLEQWLEKRGKLPVEQAVGFALQACEALAEAHALGIVHRDLKPANLFVTSRADGSPSVKILDFGISKTNAGGDEESLSLTKTSEVMGSPLYMSPEQLESSKSVDARTDIWALGVVLYQLITDRLPFEAATLPELFTKVLTRDPTPVRDYRPEVPEGLWHVLARCLAKHRDERYPNIAAFATALCPFGPEDAQVSVRRVNRVIHGPGAGDDEVEPLPPRESVERGGPTSGAWGQTSRRLPLSRNRGPLAVLLVSVTALGVGSYVATRDPALPPEPTPSGGATEPAPTSPGDVVPQETSSHTVAAPSASASATDVPQVVEPAPASAAPPVESPAPAPRPPPAPTVQRAPAPKAQRAPRPAPAPMQVPAPAPTPAPEPADPPEETDLFGDRK